MVGLVRGLHGLRGAVRVEILTDDPSRFQEGSILFLEGSDAPLTIAWSQADGPGILVRFVELNTRDAAASLRDAYLEGAVTEAARDADQVYWHEVLGAAVSTPDGTQLGRVEDVFRAGGAEVYVVRGGARGELLVPGVRSVITEFSPGEARIVVDPAALGLDEPGEADG